MMDAKGQFRNVAGRKIPTSSSNQRDILRYLMTYSVCPNDKDYCRRAIDSLLRKLQDNKKDIDELIVVITTLGQYPTECVTIPRTMDGRLQVATRKGFPHVVYCRIWRWQDLKKCELTHIPSCRFGYELQHDNICVNPYHYERIPPTEGKKPNCGCYASNNNDREKRQGTPQQPPLQNPTSADLQQSQDIYQLNGERLIPLVVEQENNSTGYIQPQQPIISNNYNEETIVRPQNPESYVIHDISYANNNIGPTISPGSMNHQCGYSNNLLYNLHQPAIESNLHQPVIESNLHQPVIESNLHQPVIESNSHQLSELQLLQDHGHNQHTPLQLQTGMQKNQNNFIHDNRNVETPTVLLPTHDQFLLHQRNFQSLSLANDQMHYNFQPPGSTPPSNNPPVFPDCSQQSQDRVQSNVELLHMNEMPPPNSIPLATNPMFANSNQKSQDVQSNFQIIQNNNLPLPSSTPLPNNPPMFPHNVFGGFQPATGQHNEQLKNYNHVWHNKDASLNYSINRILTENNGQETASCNQTQDILNETLDHILAQVQDPNQQLSSTDRQNEKALLDNNTGQIRTENKIERVININEELDNHNIPIVVTNYKEPEEENINQRLRPTNNVPHLARNIETVSPISAVSPLSPISAISTLSPISVISPLSPTSAIPPLSPINSAQPLSSEELPSDGYSLLLLDGNNKKTEKENNKPSTNKEHLQSDKTLFLNEDLEETLTQNNNAQHLDSRQLRSGDRSTPRYFNDSMISFINNNNAEVSQISTVSKCEQYLRNQSNAKSTLPYFQLPANNVNDPHTYNQTNNLNKAHQNSREQDNSQIHNHIQPRDIELQLNNTIEFLDSSDTESSDTSDTLPFDKSPLEHWCSIAYFEMDAHVGETFKVKNKYTTVIVDGYVDPDGGDRFCLGRLTNVRRTEQSERTRLHIAQGIALELRKDGDIWLRCKSKTSIFIQAHYLDMQTERPIRNYVHKMFSGNCTKVFDLQKCYKHIRAQIATAQAALKAQVLARGDRATNNYSVTQALKAINMNVDDLRRLCILRISFVKGWGPNYPRQTIKETPCWIEVHVHKALQILDRFLLLNKPIVRGME